MERETQSKIDESMTKTDIEGPFVMENTQRGVFSSKQRAYLWTDVNGNVSSGYGDAIMSKIDESMTKSDTEGPFVMGNTLSWDNFVISSHLMLFRNICLGTYGAMTVSSGSIKKTQRRVMVDTASSWNSQSTERTFICCSCHGLVLSSRLSSTST